MTSAPAPLSRTNPADLIRTCAFCLCLGFMGMFWIRIITIGSFSLEAYHVGMLLIIAAMLTSPASIRSVAAAAFTAWWTWLYIAYLLLLVPAVVNTPGSSIPVRQMYFLLGFFCIAGYLSSSKHASGALRLGALCGVGLFLVVLEYSARLAGGSMARAFIDFMTTGNLQALIYRFFRPAFNALVQSDEGGVTFVASITNSIAVSLFVLALCFEIGSNGKKRACLGLSITMGILALVILLDARSVLVCAALSFAVAGLVRVLFRRGLTATDWMLYALGGILVLLAAIVLFGAGGPAMETIVRTMSFQDASTQSRVQQYGWGFGLIEDNFFLGAGYQVSPDGYVIHNLFLSAWAYAGVGCFILVVGFYIGILWVWIRWIYLCLTRRQYWVLNLRFEWVAALPVILLFRVWISGGGGHPGFGEWVALGIFVGLLMRNEAEAQRAWSSEPTKVFRIALPGASDTRAEYLG